MNTDKRIKALVFVSVIAGFFSFQTFAEDKKESFPNLTKISSEAELKVLTSGLNNEHYKKALLDNAEAVIAASKRYPHVEAVIGIIESSPGLYTKVNLTPAALKNAAGGDLKVFDTLTEVSTKIHKGKAHTYRNSENDPYDAGFIEHLGHIDTLESVKIVATGIEDSWLAPLLKLSNLKTLYIEGRGRLGDESLAQLKNLSSFKNLTTLELAYFGKATDAGLELLAGIKNLERFTFRGSPIKGHAFAKFKGWNKLKYINFHSNRLDDKGFAYVCEQFPNLEFIKLWHSQGITDASAVHIKNLRNLKGIEISSKYATAALLKDLNQLPLEYAALSYGVNSPAADAIATAKSISTLKKLKIEGPKFTDQNLKDIACINQIEELSIERLSLNEDRIELLKDFSYLKKFSLVERRKNHWYSDDIKQKVSSALPKVSVEFVK
ncbi:MAG: hypothetical protein NE327_12315 [Lentisphaeraceae bacterium]|nr:hypothetical protein [Lentisphaeraceae bacterium]